MGRLRVDRKAGRDVLMIAGGTGVAPMRAIIEHLAQWGENPRVQLFYGGRVREDLYDLEHLQQIAAHEPVADGGAGAGDRDEDRRRWSGARWPTW